MCWHSHLVKGEKLVPWLMACSCRASNGLQQRLLITIKQSSLFNFRTQIHCYWLVGMELSPNLKDKFGIVHSLSVVSFVIVNHTPYFYHSKAVCAHLIFLCNTLFIISHWDNLRLLNEGKYEEILSPISLLYYCHKRIPEVNITIMWWFTFKIITFLYLVIVSSCLTLLFSFSF